MTKDARLGEIALIADYLAPLASYPGAFGLKDDAALLKDLPPHGLVVTSDALVAGVHFFEDDTPGDVAYKALAVNVSDLAAKAARPLAYTLTLALTEAPSVAWASNFAAGLRRGQDAFGIALIGGDTVSARGAWWISITAFGEAAARGLVPRGGARPGDALYVSGTLGDSALGLELRLRPERFANLALDDGGAQHLRSRYLHPEPRLGLAPALAAHASAAMDISDGLALDLSRMCAASGVSAEVWSARLPLSQAARTVTSALPGLVQRVIAGGDDYEILAAVPEDRAGAFEAAAKEAGLAVTRVGTVLQGTQPPRFLSASGETLDIPAPGFEHFKTNEL